MNRPVIARERRHRRRRFVDRLDRPMKLREARLFKRRFPRLDTEKARVTGEATHRYSCVSWTLGITTSFIWPGSSIADFDAFYAYHGYVRSRSGPIAVWGRAPWSMTHASLDLEVDERREPVDRREGTDRWESKCGRDLRIQHNRYGLVGRRYGRILAYYRPRLAASKVSPAEPSISPPSYGDLALFRARPEKKIITAEDADFEEKFEAWKRTWDAEGPRLSSDPASRAVGPEFEDLVKLGPSILPGLVEKLIDPDNFFALQLYDAIQSRYYNAIPAEERIVVRYGRGDARLIEGEQSRAQRVVRLWILRQ